MTVPEGSLLVQRGDDKRRVKEREEAEEETRWAKGRRRLKERRGKKEINERKRETVAKGWKEEAGPTVL